jgi:hypothetical protein
MPRVYLVSCLHVVGVLIPDVLRRSRLGPWPTDLKSLPSG